VDDFATWPSKLESFRMLGVNLERLTLPSGHLRLAPFPVHSHPCKTLELRKSC